MSALLYKYHKTSRSSLSIQLADLLPLFIQQWNENKCRCECKELIDGGICNKGFIGNPSNCECECDKNCDFNAEKN